MKDVQVKKIIEVSVSNQQLVAKTPCRLVAGTRGLYAVRVTYDDEWNETPHILLQFNGCKTKEVDIRDASEPIDVPWECIEEACYLSLALLGMDGNGELKLTTYSRNNNSLIVYPKDWRDKGEDDEDRDPLPPTPTIWEDLKEQLSEKADAEDVEKAIGELEEEIAKKADAQEVNNKFSGIEEQLNKKVGSEELTNAIDDLSNDIQKDFKAIEDELGKKVNSEDIQDILDDVDNTIQEEIKELDNKIDGKADTETVNIGFENISKQLANKADAKTVQDGFDGLEEEISKKADTETVQNSLNGLGTEIAKKADSETVQSSLNELSAEVAKKANTESVQGVIDEISGDLEKCAEAILKVNDDVNNKADVIINNVGGEEIAVYDSKETVPNIKTFGKGMQKQYEGNQLLDINNIGELTKNGVTLSKDGDYISIQGSGTYTNIDFDIPCIIPNGAKVYFYLLEGDRTNMTFYFRNADKLLVNGSVINPNGVYTVSDEVAYFRITCKEANYSTKLKIMITSKANAEWEPFAGGKTSPSPDYPQEVSDIGSNGNINITCGGKNFIPYPYFQNTVTQYGVTFTTQADGGIAGSGTATNAAGITIYDGAVLGKGIVTASLSGTFSNMVWSITLYDESNVKIVTHQNKALLTFNLDDYPTAKRMVMMVKRSSNAAVKGVAYPQLELGETVTSYGKNIESQTLTLSTPNGLRGIPLGTTIQPAIAESPIHMSGVYWDEATGQYYIADTKNENGKDVQRIKRMLVKSVNSYSAEKFGGVSPGDTLITTKERLPLFSTHFKFAASGKTNGICFSYSGQIRLYRDCEGKEAFNEWLTQNEVYVDYILAEPIITDISEEELTQYNALHMNYPNTSIINDSGAYIDVEYVADTKSYIDNTQGNQGSEEIDIRLDGLESEMDNKANIDDVEIAFTQLENEIDKKATITEVQEIENKVNKNIEDIEQLSEKVDDVESSLYSYSRQEEAREMDLELQGGLLHKNGIDIYSAESYNFKHIELTNVSAGEKYLISGYVQSSNYPLYILFDDDSVVGFYAGTTGNSYTDLEYVVSENVSKIVINGVVKYTNPSVKQVSFTETKIFNIEQSPLVGKKIAVDGDSICFGNGYAGGYGKIIADNNNMKYQNIGVGGATLTYGTCESVAYGTVLDWNTNVYGLKYTCYLLPTDEKRQTYFIPISESNYINGFGVYPTLHKNVDGVFVEQEYSETRVDGNFWIKFDVPSYDSDTMSVYYKLSYSAAGDTMFEQYKSGFGTSSYTNTDTQLYTEKHIVSKGVDNIDEDADYIVIEGGINDYLSDRLFGELTNTCTDKVNPYTVIGAMEVICRKLLVRFIGKKVCFVFIHKPSSKTELVGYAHTEHKEGYGTFADYHDAIISVLNKYSIPVCDLFMESTYIPEIPAMVERYGMAGIDGVHPNEACYREIYVPKIEAKLKSL